MTDPNTEPPEELTTAERHQAAFERGAGIDRGKPPVVASFLIRVTIRSDNADLDVPTNAGLEQLVEAGLTAGIRGNYEVTASSERLDR